jgi:NAD+ synthase
MFSSDVLKLDPEEEATFIARTLRQQVLGELKRKGLVVGISGGIDSALVTALAVRALGKDRVVGLFMPERASSSDSLRLGKEVAQKFGIRAETVELDAALEGMGCYRTQDEAVRAVFPDYQPDWRFKISLPSILTSEQLNFYQLTVQTPAGEKRTQRMPLEPYLKLVAATNLKQRARKVTEYFYADRLSYAVAGTPNRLEYDQGFFVKQGDGAADVKPIAHLYKTQVYALAKHLGVPDEIQARQPTTETYSLEQSQEELYFPLPYDRMDLCLWARNHPVPAEELAAAVNLTPEQVSRVFRDLDTKRRTTRYQHARPLLVRPVDEVHG